MLSRFHMIPERNGRTDGRTDGETDRQICYINILIDNLTWLILILSQHLIQLTG